MLNLVSIHSMVINGKRPPDQFCKASDTPPSSATAYHSLFFHAHYQSLKDIQLPSIYDWQVKHRSSYGPTVFLYVPIEDQAKRERNSSYQTQLTDFIYSHCSQHKIKVFKYTVAQKLRITYCTLILWEVYSIGLRYQH